MSTPKRKAGHGSSQPFETFDAILGIIARVKPKLADLSQRHSRIALEEDLQRLTALGETLAEQKQRYKVTADVVDTLDREGVHLWNISKLLSQRTGDDEDRSLFAALRLSGFRLIEAGLEQKPGVETLINILQLASKTGTALSEIGKNDVAASVLAAAAKFEEQLQNAEDFEDDHSQAKARAVLLYYCSRMVAAWRDGNDAIAQFMLEKITESDERRLSLLSASDQELLASKIMDIGKSVLKASARKTDDSTAALADAKKGIDAVKWLQKAFTIVEHLEESDSIGITDLRRGILRSLVRAYYISSSIDPENLARAETTLQELIIAINSSGDKKDPEQRQLRWMWLAILKKRKAPESALLEAFTSIVDHTIFTDSETTEILQELRTVTQQQRLVSDVLQQCILRVLVSPATNPAVDRFLLALISHCARDQDSARAIKDIEVAFSSLTQAEFELGKNPAMACVTVLWKVGDRHFQMKKWSQAAEWFLIGAHKAFASIAHMCRPKSLRKAALCYIEQQEYARASQIIQQCPSDQSYTFYLQFLAAIHQGMEVDAVLAIQNMAKASDFDRRMLLLATQLSHESDMRMTLLAALEALLRTLQTHGPTDSDVEAICLARCIVRLTIRLSKEAIVETERVSLVSTLIRHLSTASTLVKSAVTGKSALFVAKDVSWLWRTAYNTALQGCSEWQHAEIQIADLFDLAYELAHAYSCIAVANMESDVYICMAHSVYSSLSARTFALDYSINDGENKMVILKDIQRAKETLAFAKERIAPINKGDLESFDELLHSVQVVEAETLCRRKEWDKLLLLIHEIGISSGTLASHEAISELLWSNDECPVNVLYIALESLLHSCLECGRMSVEKFSRWLRAICTILLSRNCHSDRTKAVKYVEQALTVLENQSGGSENEEEVYPIDERQWLLSTAYNTGVECLASSNLDEAKRWFELATVVCRFVPDGARHSDRISGTYRRLLDQYAQQES